MFKAIATLVHSGLCLFGMASPRSVNKYEVLFGPAAAGHGEHGSLQGTWLKEGFKQNITISFFFKGMGHAPRMNVEVLEELFRHARHAGIVPSHLFAYGGLHNPKPIPGTRR